MFAATTYTDRRAALAARMRKGVILIQGAPSAPRNYPANTYPFRQSSHLLYYAGIDRPDLVLLLDSESGEATLYGPPWTTDDMVWCGARPSLEELAAQVGITRVRLLADLGADVSAVTSSGRMLHYLPPYRASMTQQLASLLEFTPACVPDGVSPMLIEAIAEQRLVKTDEEITQIEAALEVTHAMFCTAMEAARPGLGEADIAGIIQGVALRHDRQQCFLPITTVRGEVLHNEFRPNTLGADDLLCIDAGAESPLYYASDITRTFPVRGTFDERQRGIYQVVLDAQQAAIAATRPGVRYRDVHLLSATVIAEGLTALGLMKGDPAEAVAAGAHAMFYPHGLGHALGVDVHDMEDLGDAVGYGRDLQRSDQFGLNFLRFARALEPGYVMTAEPGIYFIGALIDLWQAEGRHADFIDYAAVAAYRGFGGIRIEDDVLVTAAGSRVLGPPIPRTPAEIEAQMAAT
jgi:Xaa-Pro aminopeptidase